MVAINLLLMSALFAQTMKSLSPEVHEYVKVEAPVIALVHARVIDGNGSAARENQTIIIRDGKIQSVSDAATASVPPDAMNFDVTGRSVIPGLIDMHGHMFYTAGNVFTRDGKLAAGGIT
ncbi:MAG: hypothetical protein DMG71_12515, partial [Acidobacteria bacterium]